MGFEFGGLGLRCVEIELDLSRELCMAAITRTTTQSVKSGPTQVSPYRFDFWSVVPNGNSI